MAERNEQRVLLVEDEWLLALDMGERVESLGLGVVGPAPNAEKALELILSERIDAALLDLNLAEGRSIPVAVALRERGVPFAFISGHTVADLPVDFRNERLLTKPVSDRDLVATLERLLTPIVVALRR